MNPDAKVIPIDTLIDRASGGKGLRQLSGAEALELQRRLEAEGTTAGVVAPICLTAPANIAPLAYVMHTRKQICTNCKTESRHTDLYAFNQLRSRIAGKSVRHLVPVKEIVWNVPVQTVPLAPTSIPFCWECADAAIAKAATCPKPPVAQALASALTGDTAPSAPKPKTSASKPTIDDL